MNVYNIDILYMGFLNQKQLEADSEMDSKVVEKSIFSDLSRIMEWKLGGYYWVTIDRCKTAYKKGKLP